MAHTMTRLLSVKRPGLLLLGAGCVLLGLGVITWPKP